MNIKKILTCAVCLIPISCIKPVLLNALGHKVSPSARIKISFVFVDLLILDNGALIKNFNLIKAPRVVLRKNAWIGNFNFIGGDFDLILKEGSKIINLNIISRGRGNWRTPRSKLIMGSGSQVTSLSTVELAASVIVGEDTVLAGKGIQVWSHGFVHEKSRKRNLVVGKVRIGNNVYVGARACLNPGVRIGDNITIGVNSVVSKDLLEEGMYVSAPMRFVDFDPESKLKSFAEANVNGFVYYEKK